MFPIADTLIIVATLVITPAEPHSKAETPYKCEGFVIISGQTMDVYLPCLWLFEQGRKDKGTFRFSEGRTISRRESDGWLQYFDKKSGLMLHFETCPPDRAK